MTPSTALAMAIFSLASLYLLAISTLRSFAWSSILKNSSMSPSRFSLSILWPFWVSLIFFVTSRSSDLVGCISRTGICASLLLLFRVVLLDNLPVDLRQRVNGQGGKQFPAQVQRLLDRPILVFALPHDPVLARGGEI